MLCRYFRYFVEHGTGVVVRYNYAAIAIFTALPRRAFIVTWRQDTFRLQLIFRSKVAFDARLFQASECYRFSIFGFPFDPYAAVRPSATIFRPFNSLFFFRVCDDGCDVHAGTINSIQVNGIANCRCLVELRFTRRIACGFCVYLASEVLLSFTYFVR